MSTAIAGKKLSTKRAEWDVRQRARQSKAHPECRSTTIKLSGHANIACVIVAPRQSSSRRDRRNGHPDCRCVPIQIVAQHKTQFALAPNAKHLWAGSLAFDLTLSRIWMHRGTGSSK